MRAQWCRRSDPEYFGNGIWSINGFVSLSVIFHYGDVIMDTMASQTTSLINVYSTVYSAADQRKHHSSASLAFLRGIHRGLVNSPHKGPVTRKMFPLGDVIMQHDCSRASEATLKKVHVLMGPCQTTTRQFKTWTVPTPCFGWPVATHQNSTCFCWFGNNSIALGANRSVFHQMYVHIIGLWAALPYEWILQCYLIYKRKRNKIHTRPVVIKLKIIIYHIKRVYAILNR